MPDVSQKLAQEEEADVRCNITECAENKNQGESRDMNWGIVGAGRDRAPTGRSGIIRWPILIFLPVVYPSL